MAEAQGPVPRHARYSCTALLGEGLPDEKVKVPEDEEDVGFSWKKMFAFVGPAIIVAIGFTDPGNFATDIAAGARFGYMLLWLLVVATGVALVMQYLAARLGIVTGRDLAQQCRDTYPRYVALLLWGLAEIAIIASDMTEILGTAVGLKLVTGLPIVWGVVVTSFDTLLFLGIQRFGVRKLEAFVGLLLVTIFGCYVAEVAISKPDAGDLFVGFIPTLSRSSLYLSISILGAVVMPHNLYLHSALVQSREFGRSEKSTREAILFNFVETSVSLFITLVVSLCIMIVAAAVFYVHGKHDITLEDAPVLLEDLLQTRAASILFGFALLVAGQASTIGGTYAGQFVMEGFLEIPLPAWLSRLFTRAVAIVPTLVTTIIVGGSAATDLIVLSQVILSLQLPFAVIPLVKFASSPSKMERFRIGTKLTALAWCLSFLIVGINLWLGVERVFEWVVGMPRVVAIAIWTLSGVFGALYVALAGYLLLHNHYDGTHVFPRMDGNEEEADDPRM